MSVIRTALPLLLAVAFGGAPAGAQPQPPGGGKAAVVPAKVVAAATPANAQLAQLEDRRSSGSFPRCTLGIELPDIPAFDAKAARVIVTKGVDDLGTDLVPEDAATKTLEPTQRGAFAKQGDATVTIVFADLKNPPRKAKALREVSGEIELYLPGRDSNGEARFPKILSWAGKALTHAALQANAIEISYLSVAQIGAERKKAEAAERAKLKKSGTTDAETVRELVESALSSFPKGGEGEIVLRVKDPKKVIQDITMADGQGNPVFAGKLEEAGLLVLSFLNDTPRPDWEMRVQARTGKSLVRQTFSFRDLPLP